MVYRAGIYQHQVCNPVSFRSRAFNVGPLWVRSKHNLTFPLALGTKIKLLHHTDISSTPNGTIICCLFSHSSFYFSSFAVHKLLFLVVPDMSSCSLLLTRKMYPQSTLYQRKRSLKSFIVCSVFDCFTGFFVSFFVVAGMRIIRHLGFVCARTRIIRYIVFVFTFIICIWLCLFAPVCFAFLIVCCMPSLHVKLNVGCFVVYSLTHDSDYAEQFCIWYPEQCLTNTWHYKGSVFNTFIIGVLTLHWASTELFYV